MELRVRCGPIIAQRAVDVLPDDDEAALHKRITVQGRALLAELVNGFARSVTH